MALLDMRSVQASDSLGTSSNVLAACADETVIATAE
jgi:hypothetical protein